MKNPFKTTPDGNPYGYRGTRRGPSSSFLGSNKLKILAGIVTFIVIIIVMSESVVVVQAGHRGIVLYLGAVENRVLGEGVHFIIPFAEQVVQLEVRTLKFQADASAASNDLQEVATVIALNYHIDSRKAKVVAFQKYLTEQNNLKAVQVVANQTVVQAQAQARANVARASGEGQAIKVITEQLRQSPQYLQWQSINRWNGQMPYSLGGAGAFPFLQLPLQQPQSAQSNQTR